MTDIQNKHLEYPVIADNNDFIKKLQNVAQYQKTNSSQINKKAFYGQDASNKKIFNIQLSDQLFKECYFVTGKIIRSIFTNCIFINCDFSAAQLFNVTFTQCTFRQCNFDNAIMQDVKAINCVKTDCKFTNVDFSKNVIGFEQTQNKIIQDSIQNVQKTQNNDVYLAVKTALSDWNQIQQMNFQLVGQDQNCGLAIYPNKQKNSNQTEDYWQFVFFYGNQSVLMNDFNLYGMTSDQILSIVNRWKNNDLIQQSKVIINNILKIIGDK